MGEKISKPVAVPGCTVCVHSVMMVFSTQLAEGGGGVHIAHPPPFTLSTPQSTYRGRGEIGEVYLPCQLERTLRYNFVKGGGRAPPTLTSLGWFYPHDGKYARKLPLPLCVLCDLQPCLQLPCPLHPPPQQSLRKNATCTLPCCYSSLLSGPSKS